MDVELTNQQVRDLNAAFPRFTDRLAGMLSIKYARIRAGVNEANLAIDVERLALARQYADRDKEGEIVRPETRDGRKDTSQITLDPERREDYDKADRELMAKRVTIRNILLLTEKDIAAVQMDPLLLACLLPFVEPDVGAPERNGAPQLVADAQAKRGRKG